MRNNTKFPDHPLPLGFVTIWLALLLLNVSTVIGQELQPITIEADQATINEKVGSSIYSGHVVVKQGGMMVTATEVQVMTDNGNLGVLEAFGNPVTFSLQGDTADKNIDGECRHLVYQSKNELVVLNENAKLIQGGHTFSGNKIIYNIRDDVISAVKSDNGDQRVKITIQPQSEPNKPK